VKIVQEGGVEGGARHISGASIVFVMSLGASSQRVVDAGRQLGLDVEIHHFPDGTKTAADAAAAIGCSVSAIVKSLVFTIDDEPVLALVPGDRRLDTAALAALAGGGQVDRAPLEVVRAATGYAAGGTPPIGHANPIRVFADTALRRHEVVWAAGGTPTTVFPIPIGELERVTDAVWADLS
jgi:Cys-tRNA(Pro) deacylase